MECFQLATQNTKSKLDEEKKEGIYWSTKELAQGEG